MSDRPPAAGAGSPDGSDPDAPRPHEPAPSSDGAPRDDGGPDEAPPAKPPARPPTSDGGGATLHRRAGQVFLEACDLEGPARATYLEQACAGDPALRGAVDALLAHASGPSPLDAPVLGTDVDGLVARGAAVPERIGPYAVSELLGEGSTGRVYRAVQENPRREVAVKILRPGVADERLARRLVLEAEILARLQHPGVAHVYATGLTEGPGTPVPWLAMELVEGPAITAWADQQGLSVDERVELLVAVCDAVHHAHLRGVIHRDLKADNILVTPRGQPKVLDFGVARDTVGDIAATTLVSAPGDLVGTLATMSPEQVGAHPEDVDIRVDVYALGVLAYQLLAGRLPHDLSGLSLAEASRVIAEEPALPLGRHDRRLAGDLETIVATALHKNRARRYASADALGEDLERWRRGEPIAARREGTLRAALRFARRHPWVTSGLVLLVTALGATVIVQRQAARAAKQQSVELRATLRALGDVLASTGLGVWRGEETVAELMARAGDALPHYADGDPGLEGVLWTLVGRYHYHTAQFPARRRAAEAAYARGLALEAAAYGDDDPRTLSTLVEFAEFLELQGEGDRAGELLTRFWPHADVFDPDDERLLAARALRARLAGRSGDEPGALAQLRDLWGEARAALGDEHDITLGVTLLATHLAGDGRLREASIDRLLERLDRGPGDEHLARALFALGSSLLRDDPERALVLQRRAIASLEPVLGDGPLDGVEALPAGVPSAPTPGPRRVWTAAGLERQGLLPPRVERDDRELARRLYRTMHAGALVEVGRADDAACLLLEDLAAWERDPGPASRQALDARLHLAAVRQAQDRPDDAEGQARLVLALLPDPPGAALDLHRRATLLLARCLGERGAYREAEGHLHRLDALLDRAFEHEPGPRQETLELLHRLIAAHRRADAGGDD